MYILRKSFCFLALASCTFAYVRIDVVPKLLERSQGSRRAPCPASHHPGPRKRKSRITLDHAPQSKDDSHIPEVALEGVYRRAMKNKSGTFTRYMYEPRFKPPRERLETCTTLKFNCLPLGGYNTPEEAKILYQIASFFYGKGEDTVQLQDGLRFSIPSVSEKDKCPPFGQEKRDWVAREAKAVYALLLKEKARRAVQLENPALEASSHDGHERGVACCDFPPSTEIDASSPPGTSSTAVKVTCVTSSYGGNGVGQSTAPESNWPPTESMPDAELFSVLLSSPDLELVPVFWKEKDVPAAEFNHGKVASDDSNTAFVCGSESVSPLLPQSSVFHIPTTALAANLSQLDGGAQGLELMESPLRPATMVNSHQLVSVPEQNQLQQLDVTCQQKHLTELAGWKVELQQKLCETEGQKLRLQQKLCESEGQKLHLQQKLCESEGQKLQLQQELSQSEAHNRSLQREKEQLETLLQQIAKLISDLQSGRK